jgi:uncharacterized UPF0160 family protein
MVQPIDAADNGVMVYKPTDPTIHPYLFDNVLSALTPTWRDSQTVDQTFFEIVPFLQMVLTKEIEKAKYFFIDSEQVKKAYKNAIDKRIIVLDHSYAWKSVISRFPEPQFVVYPDQLSGEWVIACVKKNPRAYEYRRMLPRAWAGKKMAELSAITGIPDAEFCHKNCFIGKAWSEKGAVDMAKLALDKTL